MMSWLNNLAVYGAVLAGLMTTANVSAQVTSESSAFDSLPVKEITVFKDGHAFVLHEGNVATDNQGQIHFDYLPSPVMGTFWAYSADPALSIVSVAAGRKRVSLKRTALEIPELLRANIGKRVEIREQDRSYRGTIISVPTRPATELDAASADEAPHLPQPGNIILLKNDEGTRVVRLEQIQDVTFLDAPLSQLEYEEFRNVLRLRTSLKPQQTARQVRVGMTYLQRGIRWIPHYNIKINDDGTVLVKLQATLLNELADLENVTAHLLVGVPSFDFKDTIDPIALRQSTTQLSQYFQSPSQTAFAFSNSIMTQTQGVRTSEFPRQPVANNAPVDLGPDVAGSGKNEEMYIFTIKDVTLAKGERMLLPVGEWSVKFTDVFQLDIPSAPPLEVRRSFNTTQQAQLASMLHAPKVKHVLRITNSANVPFTTAPALITSQRGVLGQGLMTYTSPGGTVDLNVTTAVGVSVSHQDDEVKRSPDVVNWSGYKFSRIELAGSIRLTNFRDKDISLEVVRTIMGDGDQAGENGQISRPAAWADNTGAQQLWWQWYSWPRWWHHMNPQSRFRWQFTLKAGETIELPYQWHYHWTW